jgi:hypothetical protein
VPAPPEGAAQALGVALDLLKSARSGQPVRSQAAVTHVETT